MLTAGTQIDTVSVIGGGSVSQLWGKILASVLNRNLVYGHGGEVGPAYGAARLAKIGLNSMPAGQVCVAPKVKYIIKPDAIMSGYYSKQHLKYQQLLSKFKTSFLSFMALNLAFIMNHYASHKTVIRRSHEPSNGRALNFIVNHQHIINTLLILYQHSINTVSMHGSHNPQKMVFT